jgi:hypothetical protein
MWQVQVRHVLRAQKRHRAARACRVCCAITGAIAEPIGLSVRSEKALTDSLNAADSVNGFGICWKGPGGSNSSPRRRFDFLDTDYTLHLCAKSEGGDKLTLRDRVHQNSYLCTTLTTDLDSFDSNRDRRFRPPAPGASRRRAMTDPARNPGFSRIAAAGVEGALLYP